MEDYAPIYKITPEIMSLVYKIAQDLERVNIMREQVLTPQLRRENRIKTIRSSLRIEANSLSLEQVSDVINGKRVLAPRRDIQEVKNAIEAYNNLLNCDPYDIGDLLAEHKMMTKDLVREAGRFRSRGVGVYAGDVAIHIAPSADRVPLLMKQLLDWTKHEKLPQVLKSCIFHYEFEFIHPFADGNGRMGRMWQTLLLYQDNPVFGWLPVETIIAARQDAYYEAIQRATAETNSAIFAEFMLTALSDALVEFRENQGMVDIPLDGPLSDTARAVFEVILEDPFATYQEIAEKTGRTTRTVQRALADLKDRGIIQRVGADKAGRWDVVRMPVKEVGQS